MGSISYNSGATPATHIFRATSGGTVFSANLNATAGFNFFDNAAVVNDAIYFGHTGAGAFSDIQFTIGTAIAATSYTIVWERYHQDSGSWKTITNCLDETVGFSVTGSKKFKFGLANYWTKNNVNSVGCFWVRARLVAVSGIANGGANITNTITLYDGKCYITGYTDASPCTPDNVYIYLTTSFPWLGITRTNTHYDFTAVSLFMNSRFYVSGYSIEFGMGGAYPGQYSVEYLQMGNKINANFGYGGGVLWVKAQSNSYPFNFGLNTKIYGSVINGVGGVGYPGWFGEFIDSDMDGINFNAGNAIVTNCRITAPGTWIFGGGVPTFVNCKIIITGSSMAYFYNADVVIQGLNYAFTAASGKQILYFYQTCTATNFTFINPSPVLPGATTANQILRRDSAPYAAIAKVWYFNGSSYTDYTTQFSDASTNDAPVSGEVGDCYYFGTMTPFWTPSFQVVSDLSSNDYEYVWEYYNGGTWYQFGKVWDKTANFTSNNYLWLGKALYLASDSSLNINGYTGYWRRLRITKKGTGSKFINQLLISNQTGACDYRVYEKFTLDLSLIDPSGLEIPWATVTITLNGGTIYSGAVDSSGNMVQQTLTYRMWFFDPINSYSNPYQTGELTLNDYDLVITKSGYETLTTKLKMNQQKVMQITLNPIVNIRKSIDGKFLKAISPETGSSAKLIEL